MNEIWKKFLADNSAVFDQESVIHFGDAASELQAAASTNIVCDLSHLDCLRVSGEDAAPFLLNQFSNDINALNDEHSQLTTYCNPKGRMFALFRVLPANSGYLLISDQGIGSSLQSRLKMFVMRSKVVIENIADQLSIIGISGNDSRSLLREATNIEPPVAENSVVKSEFFPIFRQAGVPERFVVLAEPAQMQEDWRALSPDCHSVGRNAWEWLDIRAGLPSIHTETSETFIPQMLNLDVLNALNFKKGCYPGQEIIARMKYLGKLKQRMFIGHGTGEPPAPGESIFAQGFGEQSAGTIVNAVPAPEGGFDCLFVVQLKVAGKEPVHVASMDGPELILGELPYDVPVEGETAA